MLDRIANYMMTLYLPRAEDEAGPIWETMDQSQKFWYVQDLMRTRLPEDFQ